VYVKPNAEILPDTDVLLGQIVYNFQEPRTRLGKPLPIALGNTSSAFNRGHEIIKTESTSLDDVSAFAHVHDYLKLGFTHQAEDSDRNVTRVDKVRIEQFVPDDDYVEQSFKAKEVERHLKQYWLSSPPLYMICGLKVAVGGATTRTWNSKSKTKSGDLAVAAPSHEPEAPASFEVGREAKRHDASDFALRATHQFVFAYRLRRIIYDKKTRIAYSDEVIKWNSEGGTVPPDTNPDDIVWCLDELLEYDDEEGLGIEMVPLEGEGKSTIETSQVEGRKDVKVQEDGSYLL
jgi:hypothetical protein